mgnify:CR=1 FL=1
MPEDAELDPPGSIKLQRIGTLQERIGEEQGMATVQARLSLREPFLQGKQTQTHDVLILLILQY